ncbi:hypothetical protein T440DRAFT_478393 [Plenodomus tracheiphilus IPT5]|uniref:Uncharacterized protein n=1 Tax=Plenodomus tracheiphilus IPT5 TaxID=1408161 RepID=A0A6A7B706_9PLEO|nr:hypothetical protein T440DRAFT_478393 [Plenodomus tracheiphilus IPT5]
MSDRGEQKGRLTLEGRSAQRRAIPDTAAGRSTKFRTHQRARLAVLTPGAPPHQPGHDDAHVAGARPVLRALLLAARCMTAPHRTAPHCNAPQHTASRPIATSLVARGRTAPHCSAGRELSASAQGNTQLTSQARQRRATHGQARRRGRLLSFPKPAQRAILAAASDSDAALRPHRRRLPGPPPWAFGATLRT